MSESSENNVFNELSGPLAADATIVSDWYDMRGFQAVSGILNGDEIFAEVRFEWSVDKATVQLSQIWFADGNPISYGGAVAAATMTQAKYVRLVVINGPTPQTDTWRALVTLLESPPTGIVSPLVEFPRDSDPGQTVKAVLFGRRLGDVEPQYTHVLVDNGGEIIISEGPLPTTEFDQRIPATLVSTEVLSFSPENRSSLSIYNSSTAGNMYVRLGEDVDVALNDWSWRVLPGWTWIAPRWGAEVYIAWDDDTDGFAHCSEVTG